MAGRVTELKTDAQLVTDLQTAWTRDTAAITRMNLRLDKLAERVKTSIIAGLAADSPPLVYCPDGAPEAPAMYVGFTASGAAVALVIALDDLAGGLQWWRPQP